MVGFHRVLISTAIIFSLGFATWAGVAYRRTGEFWAAASAVGFALATIAFFVYLKNLNRFLGR